MAENNLTNEEFLAKSKTLLIVQGVLLILLGIVTMALPFFTTIAVEIIVAFAFFFGGLVQIINAFTDNKEDGFWWQFFSGTVYLLGGLFLLFNPSMGMAFLTLFVASLFFVGGLLDVTFAIMQRKETGWGLLLFNGIVGILLAICVWTGFPVSALWFIGLLVGANIMLSGIMVLISANLINKDN